MPSGDRIVPDGNREVKKGKLVSRKALGRNKVYFIHHALVRMKERGVTEDEVFETLAAPDDTGLPADPPRLRVRKHRNRRTSVDVVYELTPAAVRVITVVVKINESPSRAARIAQRKQRRRRK
jgi:hypothetical protein